MSALLRQQIAIVHKDRIFACLSLAITADRNIVGNCDPRSANPHFYTAFETPALAEAAFTENVAITRERGWTVVYNGPPLHG